MKIITIGRSRENDVIIEDAKVSRNHVQLVQNDNNNYFIVDLGSSNGTFVNGQRISGEVRLMLDDIVQIGNTKLDWQSYFYSEFPKTQKIPEDTRQQNGRLIWWIVAACIVLLFILGGLLYYINSKNEKEITRQEEIRKDSEKDLTTQYKQKLLDAETLKKDVEVLYQEAISVSNTEHKKLAEEIILQKDKDLKQVREFNKQKERLTKELYEVFETIKWWDDYNKICKELKVPSNNQNISIAQMKKDIKSKFEEAEDNNEKEKILQAINKVLGRETKDEKQQKEQSNQNTVDSANTAASSQQPQTDNKQKK
ncbi:MAG: FHA domain-containing protein [Bacteroidales bacterium]|jgi:pSer/pThr/pTyr-binding forkhead associated (FHA) protein|nr:FHA domain-containing protein [Bacteroidales bacterium]